MSPAAARARGGAALICAGVVVLRQHEEVRHDPSDSLRVGASFQEILRFNTHFGEAGLRELDAPERGVFLHVTADVRELHRDAEVDRVRDGSSVSDAEDAAHHESDGARHPVAVADQGAVVREARRVEVTSHPSNQLQHGLNPAGPPLE